MRYGLMRKTMVAGIIMAEIFESTLITNLILRPLNQNDPQSR